MSTQIFSTETMCLPAIDSYTAQLSTKYVVNAAVINDTVIPIIPTCRAITLDDQLSCVAEGFMNIRRCDPGERGLFTDSVLRQLCKGQDEVYTCKTSIAGMDAVCALLFDGHGGDDCIDAIREAPIDEIIRTSLDPIQDVHNRLHMLGKKINLQSGSTGLYARLTDTTIDCSAVGDSFMFVFVNGKQVWKSTPHTIENPLEVARHAHDYTIVRETDTRIQLLSETRIAQVPASRTHFKRHCVKLCPTMSLGHQNITGMLPETFHLDYAPGDYVRVVGFSDGICDMLYLDGLIDNIALQSMSAEELFDLAMSRYTQDWIIEYKGRDFPNRTLGKENWDDCSAFVLQNYQ